MHVSIRRGRDKDGNRWGVGLVFDEDRRRGHRWRVAIHADGCWLATDAAARLQIALHRATLLCNVRNRNDRRKP